MSSRGMQDDATARARRVIAEGYHVRMLQRWIGDELIAGTVLGIFGAVAVMSIVALFYFSSF